MCKENTSKGCNRMTREEVINELIEMCNYVNGNIEIRSKQYEALNMAIKALKQPEIIRCKDCCFYAISKEKRSWCKDMLRRIQPEDFCSHARS